MAGNLEGWQFQPEEEPGACPDGWCITPPFIDVPDSAACADACRFAPVACCLNQPPDFPCDDSPQFTLQTCTQVSGLAQCPPDCTVQDCADVFGEGPVPCCLPDNTCSELLREVCATLNGYVQENQEQCGVEACIDVVQCRSPREPQYLMGDKAHTLQLCENAVAAFTSRPLDHDWELFPKSRRGFLELITTHETRACRIEADADPCRRHYLGLIMRPDGYVQPALYSTPYADGELNRWNFGHFTVKAEPDIAGRAPAGYLVAEVGVEPQPWSELHIHADVQRCGIDD